MLRIGRDDRTREFPEARPRGRWAEWWPVLRGVLASDAHPSRDHLAKLVRRYGVPPWAREYVADRLSGEIAPSGRPTTYHLPVSWERLYGGLSPRQTSAVFDLDRVHKRLKGYRTRAARIGKRGVRFRWLREPVRLRHIKSRNLWKVAEPKVQARRLVARCYNVAPSTLEEWERTIR